MVAPMPKFQYGRAQPPQFGTSSRLRKNSGFDFGLKGRGFNRAVSAATSMALVSAVKVMLSDRETL
jgi:hypothetical protein